MSNEVNAYNYALGFITDLPGVQQKELSLDESLSLQLNWITNEDERKKPTIKDKMRFLHYRTQALSGDADAYFAVGVIYLCGDWVKQDLSKAYSYFQKAEQKGHAIAAYNISRFWQFGLLGDDNSFSTIVYLDRAAELGYPEGFLRAADDCEKGGVFAGVFNKGATSNDILNNMWKPIKECVKLYDKAVELYCRGLLQGAKGDILHGLIFPKQRADQYFSMASSEAMEWVLKVGDAYFNGNKHVAKDPKRGFQLLSYLAPYSQAAKIELAACYYDGNGVSKDVAKCYQLLCKLTSDNKLDKNKRRAYYMLGVLYYLGEGVSVDMFKARYWFETAAQFGYENSYGILGYFYFYGLGGEKDYKKAHQYLKLSAESKVDVNATVSMGELAQMYYFGAGCQTDYSSAFHYAQKAAEGNVFQGYRILAWCYSGGKGTKVDYNAALKNCQKALAIQQDEGLRELVELLTSDGQTLHPTADTKKIFNDAAGKAIGDIFGGIIGAVIGAGSND